MTPINPLISRASFPQSTSTTGALRDSLAEMRHWLEVRDAIHEDRLRNGMTEDQATQELRNLRDAILNHGEILPTAGNSLSRLFDRIIDLEPYVPSSRLFLSPEGLQVYASSADEGRSELEASIRPALSSPAQSQLLRFHVYAALLGGLDDYANPERRGRLHQALRHVAQGSSLPEALRQAGISDSATARFLSELEARGAVRDDARFADFVLSQGWRLERQGQFQTAGQLYQILGHDPRFAGQARERLSALPSNAWIQNRVGGFTDPQSILFNVATLGSATFLGGLAERGAARFLETRLASSFARQALGTAVRVGTEAAVLPVFNLGAEALDEGSLSRITLDRYLHQVGSTALTLGLFRGISAGMASLGDRLAQVPLFRLPGTEASTGAAALRPGVRLGHSLATYGATLSGFAISDYLHDSGDHPALLRGLLAAVEDARLRLGSGLANRISGDRLHAVDREIQQSYARRLAPSEGLLPSMEGWEPNLLAASLGLGAFLASEPAQAATRALSESHSTPQIVGGALVLGGFFSTAGRALRRWFGGQNAANPVAEPATSTVTAESEPVLESATETATSAAAVEVRPPAFQPRPEQYSLRTEGGRTIVEIRSDHAAVLSALRLQDGPPITALHLRNLSRPEQLEEVLAVAASSPHDSIRELDLSGSTIGSSGVDILAEYRSFVSELHGLNLSGNRIGDAGLARLLEAGAAPSRLNLSGNNLSNRAVEALSTSESFRSVTTLNLSDNPIGPRGARVLARSIYAGSLSELNLAACRIGDEGMSRLWMSSRLPQLEKLVLSNNGIGSGPWTQHPTHLRLRRLDLSQNSIGVEGVRALAESPNLSQLNHLALSNSPMETQGYELDREIRMIRELVQSPYLRQIQHLELGDLHIYDEGVSILAAAPNLNQLRYLGLRGNIVRNDGARALANSRHLTQLEVLDLSQNPISDEAVHAIEDSPNLPRLREVNTLNNRLVLGLGR